MTDDRTGAATKKLLISFNPNPRVLPLVDGGVKPEGVDLEWDTGEFGAAFLRALTKNDFDMFEFSISHYIATRDHPNPAYAGWIAVPVFSSKPVFLYRNLFVEANPIPVKWAVCRMNLIKSGIRQPRTPLTA